MEGLCEDHPCIWALEHGFEEEGKTSFGKSWVSSGPRPSSKHLLLLKSLQCGCLDLLEVLEVWNRPCIQLGRGITYVWDELWPLASREVSWRRQHVK